MYVGIIVNNESSKVDRLFTYEVPALYEKDIALGSRVRIPFGIGNRVLDGFVMEIIKDKPEFGNIKEIIKVYKEKPILRIKDISLIEKMKKKYLATYLECIKVIIPTGLLEGMKNKMVEKVFINKELEGKYIKEPYTNIYKTIKENSGVFTTAELHNRFQFSISSINTLLKNDFLVKDYRVINRYSSRKYSEYRAMTLNKEQQAAYDKILYSKENNFLLHGVTGSGKTEIYLQLVDKMLQLGKSSIILVPEISLTPQMVERFKGRFAGEVAVFHSRLSDGERFDEWYRVRDGKVKIAIGARSAIFLPMVDLGMIIIDEEHEQSYKSDYSPKYSAIDIAEFKQSIEGIKVVLGSATPSVETYYKSEKLNKYSLITLEKRADGAVLPNIDIVDMRAELLENNKSMFSRKLFSELQQALDRKEQVILFLNRRGHSSFVSCRKCGYVFKCTDCDITLTYHNDNQAMVCHYCGKKEPVKKICPKCGSNYVKYFGVGTEKIEQEVRRLFPQARTIRMDFDTTRRKDSYENIYNIFKENRADILIGTQMIAKGLDFKNVTLVGVVAADISINLPDYKAGERTFQLLTQVSGRAGRGEKKGKVIIQTYNPEHYSLRYVAAYDYDGFYKEDLSIRENMNYPPFSEIFLVNLSGKDEEVLIKAAHSVGELLKSTIKDDKIIILGPCPCGISKIKEMYRWQIVLKGKIKLEFAAEIKKDIYNSMKNVYNDIRVTMDMNPSNLL